MLSLVDGRLHNKGGIDSQATRHQPCSLHKNGQRRATSPCKGSPWDSHIRSYILLFLVSKNSPTWLFHKSIHGHYLLNTNVESPIKTLRWFKGIFYKFYSFNIFSSWVRENSRNVPLTFTVHKRQRNTKTSLVCFLGLSFFSSLTCPCTGFSNCKYESSP